MNSANEQHAGERVLIEALGCYEIYDERFRHLIIASAELEELYSDCRWAEGPVWFSDHNSLIFSDIPNQRMLRWIEGAGVSLFRSPSNFANGNTRDRQGRLVTCEHGTRSITRTEIDGTVTTLADLYEGKRLNSPNDVIVHSDGSIWFTDPTYGILSDYEGYRAAPQQLYRNVFRLDPLTGDIKSVCTDLSQPNGLAFSLDEKQIYIADSAASHDPSHPRHIRVYDVNGENPLQNGRQFCTIDRGIPDGLRLDAAGNLWSSAGDGVHCFSPQGELLGKIIVPQVVSNLTFGGARKNRLFITATRSLYSVYLGVNGAQQP